MAALNNKVIGTNNLYSSAKLLEWSEYNIVVILSCIGLEPEDIETTTIDELINAIETIFGFGDKYPEVSLDDRQYSISAAAAFNKRQQKVLILGLRRFWRLYAIAKHEVAQNV